MYNIILPLTSIILLLTWISFSFFKKLYWGITDKIARYLKCTTWLSDICIQYKRMSPIRRIISQSAIWDQVSNRVVTHVLPCKEMYRKMVWIFGKHPFSLNKFRLRMHTHRIQARWLRDFKISFWNVICYN